ncbi:MAG: fatty acid--CoA ligase [Deltaproteobacteria bacterium]|nr:fatty acid--CoA ligase [Deltaproteobacteria bacterium]
MRSTMQDHPLTITDLFTYGRTVHADSTVATRDERGTRRATFAAVAARAERLAAALARLGVRPGDRVATFAWNSQEHLEAYFAIPAMGAVLHTLNIRLFPEQLVYVANHAEDRVVIVDDSLVPLLAKVRPLLETVEHVIVVGDGDASALAADALRYEDLLAAERPGYAWPEIDERRAAAMCYTSGTTGNPKGVVYSHRSTWLHSLALTSGAAYALNDRDRALLVVPMFHANAWGLPYAAWQVGADLVMPGRHLQAAPLARLVTEERPTVAAAVPTIWNDLLRHAEEHPVDFSSLRVVMCGGSAVPRVLMEKFEERHGVRIIQAWGMTETSPLAAIAVPPKGVPAAEEMPWRAKTGRVCPGVALRIVDDAGQPLPWDGATAGEIEVRGPWITGAYYRDHAPEKFHDGWLRTGDVGTVDAKGFVQITDRAKDVIKSGGEWISSVELENEIMAHPDVVEAAVIGIPDDRWQERPLACVVLRPGRATAAADLHAFLAGRVARWWLPERFAFIAEVPKTSVGKFDKKVLRARHAAGGLDVVEVGRS